MYINREEIVKKFLKFENENELFDFKAAGVIPWEISRVWIYLHILDFFTPVNTYFEKNSIFLIIEKILRVFTNSILSNPFFDFRKSDILVFESNRRYRVEDKYIDIYTHYFIQKLINEGANITVYQTVLENESTSYKADNRFKHLDFIHITSKLLQKFSKPKFTAAELKKIKEVEDGLRREFDFKINLKEYFEESVGKFKAELILYNRLFRLKKPKEIFIVGSSDKAALTFAAKNNDIIVNELQHGLNSDKDVILNYPHTIEESLSYFPNRFFAWDNVNMFFAKLPLKDANIMKIPNFHLDYMVNCTSKIAKEKKTILIISQPYGSEEMLRYVANNLLALQDYEIVYKIHPTENQKKFEVFKEKFSNYSNIRFVNNEDSIYILMKRAQFVVGIYSSSLFEAVAFDCRIILLNLPGVEMSFPLLKNSNCKLIDADDRLINFLTEEI